MSIKLYANTFIYSKKDPNNGHTVENTLVEFIYKAERINKNSESFSRIKNDVKVRQVTAVLYRVLLMDEVVLCMNKKELPASFKVFEARDLRSNDKKPKVFIDLTGLIKLENGYFTCKEIDKLCAYLISALIFLIYHHDQMRLTNNSTIMRSSAICYTKLFTGILDNLRVINFNENKLKISYIITVYYLYNVMQKDISTAQKVATTLLSMNNKDTSAYDYYYDPVKDFENINTFINFLSETFKLKGLTTDTFLNRYLFLYGKGTMYGTELLPAFLSVISNAYSGVYINNQKTIENTCGREMVNLTSTILRVGSELFDKGFSYNHNETRDSYR